MKFGLFSLVANHPQPISGETPTQHERLRRVIDEAVFAEELGFDAYGVGERHGEPFLSSAPPVILSAVAERSRRVRLLTTLTVISVLDPVRVAEDYATLDQLSGGRLELMIGKGNDPRHFPLFGLEEARQWEYQAEKFELLRKLFYQENVTWSGEFRTPLEDVTTQPRPFHARPRIWHGSASSTESTELAARFGDPLFTANGFHPKKKYADLIDHYRQRWADYGHNPADALVGSGAGGLYVAKTSQAAIDGFRPYFEALMKTPAYQHNKSEFTSLEEKINGGSALVGSPQQVIDKIGDYHASFGHQVQAVSADGLSAAETRTVLELFASDVIPVVRKEFPSTVWSEPREGSTRG
jgi:alkanesulfonate monooxygenase SsuD/methylene tetrahydromethanopterin reductase-like flavin-dependent oxidoreductase (luciferase family)